MSEQEQFEHREDAFSKAIRAGKRTYFFDVKHSKNNDYFLTITESKRIFESEGKFSYEKHKIFLYREDFQKFFDGFKETLEFIDKHAPEEQKESEHLSNTESKNQTKDSFSDVDFDDLQTK